MIFIVESLIPKLKFTINAGCLIPVTLIVNSEVMTNSITDGWKFPYMSCKYSHAVDASELMARFFSPLGPTATVSQVRMVGVCVGWHVVFPEPIAWPGTDTLLKFVAHVHSCVRPSVPQFPGQQWWLFQAHRP